MKNYNMRIKYHFRAYFESVWVSGRRDEGKMEGKSAGGGGVLPKEHPFDFF